MFDCILLWSGCAFVPFLYFLLVSSVLNLVIHLRKLAFPIENILAFLLSNKILII